ncbi:hypothetical protein BRCON_1509 [Candidatus Sumerlaea chitinivorans]|uniref:Uncharacterized protein n=1 Tax=Sumerlaea chitinivorans TaxID=2250252 RepID=A0A2Z4Y5R0_SUMC1|nr:hypothetical protein BRCON_1509 [Candidatus Sumerlaea chitinivorans]
MVLIECGVVAATDGSMAPLVASRLGRSRLRAHRKIAKTSKHHG